MRKIFGYFVYFVNRKLGGTNRIDNIKYGKDDDMAYDVFPNDSTESPIVIFWHGGSWKYGKKEMYHFVGDRLQKWGAQAILVGYKKYPKQTFPGFIDDALLALEQIKKNYPNRKIVLMGHSAGANTAMLVGLNKNKQADKVVSLAGVTSLGSNKWANIFGKALKTRSYDPATHLSEASKETEYLLIHGRLDNIVYYRQSSELYTKMQKHNFKVQLILVNLSEHMLILIYTFLGPFSLTRHKLKKFIFS